MTNRKVATFVFFTTLFTCGVFSIAVAFAAIYYAIARVVLI